MQQALQDHDVRLDLVIDGVDRVVSPRWVWWKGKTHKVQEVGQIYSEQRGMRKIHRDYSPDTVPKSIDEAVISLHGCPALKRKTMEEIGHELKARVKKEIGPWMLVNVGIGCNAWQAKTAAGLHKPDGLDRIDHANLRGVLSALQLTGLCGINTRYQARLNEFGIQTPWSSWTPIRATCAGVRSAASRGTTGTGGSGAMRRATSGSARASTTR